MDTGGERGTDGLFLQELTLYSLHKKRPERYAFRSFLNQTPLIGFNFDEMRGMTNFWKKTYVYTATDKSAVATTQIARLILSEGDLCVDSSNEVQYHIHHDQQCSSTDRQ